MNKIILHYDMDAFYASVEIRDNPKLKNIPIVVGNSIVTTASYEARKFGIHSAMSIFDAKKLCPNLIVVPVNKDKYRKISSFIHSLVLKITNKIEFISLDEGYIDITECIKSSDDLIYFAQKFRERINFHTGLTCSVGIGFNKLTAKIASDINKPNGQFIFYSSKEFIDYINEKNIKIIPGVGKKFIHLLNKKQIFKVKDAFSYSLHELTSYFGKSRGELVYLSIRGIDHSSINYKNDFSSIGNENTYRFPIETSEAITKEIKDIFYYTHQRILKKNVVVKTIHIKIRFVNGEMLTRSKTLFVPTDDPEILLQTIETLLDSIILTQGVKLLGISFSNLVKKSVRQLSFF